MIPFRVGEMNIDKAGISLQVLDLNAIIISLRQKPQVQLRNTIVHVYILC